MSEFPTKIVLLEYIPTEKRVVVRGVWRDGKQQKLAPIFEGNPQNYVRVFEGFDNMCNGVGFTGLVAETVDFSKE